MQKSKLQEWKKNMEMSFGYVYSDSEFRKVLSIMENPYKNIQIINQI
jgi:hypothetical protein